MPKKTADVVADAATTIPADEKALARDREADLASIREAMPAAKWAQSGATDEYLVTYLEDHIAEIEEDVRKALHAVDPPPQKEVVRSHYRRQTLAEVAAWLRATGAGVQRAVENAMAREREAKAAAGEMFYHAPEWGSDAKAWLAEAARREKADLPARMMGASRR